MRQNLSALLRRAIGRFARANQGVTAILFAVVAMCLVTLIGGVIEYDRIRLAQSALQGAVDAAALAAKRAEIIALIDKPLAEARIAGETEARRLFEANLSVNINALAGSRPQPAISWLSDDSVSITSSGAANMIFSGLIPASFGQFKSHSVANLGASVPAEVALVLDNTASMFSTDRRAQTRFTLLRNAAKQFTHTLFNAAQQNRSSDWLRVSVVPWTTTVNVLSEAPATPDPSGNAPVYSIPDYGTQSPVNQPIDRNSRVSYNRADFAPVDWRGCIAGDAESQTPDDRGGMNWRALVIQSVPLNSTQVGFGRWETKSRDDCTTTCTGEPDPSPPNDNNNNGSGGNDDGGGSGGNNDSGGSSGGTQGFLLPGQSFTPVAMIAPRPVDAWRRYARRLPVSQTCETNCTTVYYQELVCPAGSYITYRSCDAPSINYGRTNVFNSTSTVCAPSNTGCVEVGTNPTRPFPACVADPNEWRFNRNGGAWCPWVPQTNWTKFDPIAGPNLNCPAPMLGLSSNRRQVLDTIDRMSPVPGGTHVDVGLRWGLRTLSPANGWPDFFKLSRPPLKYDKSSTKIMILITDGQNEQAIDFPGYWGCSNKSNPGCNGSPTSGQLDTYMQNWCKAIRETYKIELYTVAVNFTSNVAIQKLRDCAGDPKKAYSIDAAQLANVLNIISSSVLQLRLTR